jgi:hypothetical protein
MHMPNSLIQIETRTGAPLQVGDATVSLHTRVVQVRLPRRFALSGGRFALVWNRPISVSVQPASGPEQTIPIYDATRLAQVSLLGLSLLGALFIWLAMRRDGRRKTVEVIS